MWMLCQSWKSTFFLWISTSGAVFLDQPALPEPDGALEVRGESPLAPGIPHVERHRVCVDCQRCGDLRDKPLRALELLPGRGAGRRLTDWILLAWFLPNFISSALTLA